MGILVWSRLLIVTTSTWQLSIEYERKMRETFSERKSFLFLSGSTVLKYITIQKLRLHNFFSPYSKFKLAETHIQTTLMQIINAFRESSTWINKHFCGLAMKRNQTSWETKQDRFSVSEKWKKRTVSNRCISRKSK